MKRKDDLTMTNKQMLVAQLREEQEKNRILRIELEKAKREKNFAERDAFSEICMFNDESRKVQLHINRYKDEIKRLKNKILAVAQQNQEYRERQVKQAKIDVLAELKNKYGFYVCCTWSRATKLLGEIIDEFIDEMKNEQDTSNDTARG